MTFVSFETAKLANEKGFDQRTEKYWLVNENTGLLKEWSGMPPYLADGCDTVFMPTQEQLAKWLREEHGIFVLIDYVGIGSDDYEWGYRVLYEEGNAKRQCQRLKYIESVQIYCGGYTNDVWPKNTYENAFEFGLRKALSLVKYPSPDAGDTLT